MSFHAEQPSKDEQTLAKRAMEIVEAGQRLGIKLDPKGFIFAWVQGTRVLTERDSSGAIVSLALLAAGKRWTHTDTTASVLDIRGNVKPMLDFAKTIASALGARCIFYEDGEPVKDGAVTRRTVIEEALQ